jgi:hypothetical protein
MRFRKRTYHLHPVQSKSCKVMQRLVSGLSGPFAHLPLQRRNLTRAEEVRTRASLSKRPHGVET